MSTERRNTQSEDPEESLGILDSTGAIGTVGIGLLGDATAQVPVALPVADDDDLVDDDVTDGEAFADLVLDADPAALVREGDGIGRIHLGAGFSDIVIEIPAAAAEDVVVAELVEDGATTDHEVEAEAAGDDEIPIEPAQEAAVPDEPIESEDAIDDSADEEHAAEAAFVDEDPAGELPSDEVPADEDPVDEAPAAEVPADEDPVDEAPADEVPVDEDPVDEDPVDEVPADEADAASAGDVSEDAEDLTEDPAADSAREDVEVAQDSGRVAIDAPDRAEPVTAAVAESMVLRAVDVAAPAPVRELEVTTVTFAAAEEETMTADHARTPDPELTSRRLDQLGDRERESADLLTADRLLDASRLVGPEPEGLWSHLLYTVSGRRINLGDGKRAQQRKALSARIAAPLSGSARFVPVLSRKGGVGKTTVTALLGMALADSREDRVIAVDANPDRGTLADRIARTNSKTVRDLVRIHDQVTGYHDISAVVSRDATRLDVLASDADPRVSEAFNDEDYDQVASVAAHYYSLVLTDTGTGIVHSVMGATLDRADTIVIVAGLSVDEARLASETLTWLETNGYADKVREAVVVLNQSTPGSPMVRLGELEAHFRTRVAHVVRIPYDARIAAGSAITFAALQPETRQAARELAAIVVEGLREQAA
ncbi:MinD/ParA family ATP-binding protein [Microbacterium azadirachtae]|uniref:CobQ/CobB/MinD/ParA nucleotide binding domain protein n=1 Tax=Microbacterium azadirachtae TaxID=582680 RepID=A0A0F0LH83_9MICO|nr:MinD/ParA family protein [Microbacterium azadirachtae]KJL32592.1 CobQ/CobB/MinD/ParA nucleotide binding domain protein [Microbacterium azadirachtae]